MTLIHALGFKKWFDGNGKILNKDAVIHPDKNGGFEFGTWTDASAYLVYADDNKRDEEAFRVYSKEEQNAMLQELLGAKKHNVNGRTGYDVTHRIHRERHGDADVIIIGEKWYNRLVEMFSGDEKIVRYKL